MAAMDAEAEKMRMAMMAAAMKLHSSTKSGYGIRARNPASGSAPRAFYSGTEPTDGLLTVNFPTDIDTYNMTEGKKTTVAAHSGWAGKRFTFDIPGIRPSQG